MQGTVQPGASAEKRRAAELTYLDTTGTLVQGLLSYFNATSTTPSANRDVVLWTSFDTYRREGSDRRCLLLGYTTGFQLWDIEDLDHVQEVLSRRDGSGNILKIVPFTEVGILSLKQPLVLVVSSSLTSPANSHIVKFYSIRSGEVVTTMEFRSSVQQVVAHGRFVAVTVRDAVHVVDTVTMERVRTVSTAAAPLELRSPVALGARWLALASADSPPAVPVDQQAEDPAFRHATLQSVTRNLATGLVSLGGLGAKAVHDYFATPHNSSSSSSLSMSPMSPMELETEARLRSAAGASAVGVVQVLDVRSGRTVAHFGVEDGQTPVAHLCFDPLGLLLFVATQGSHFFSVYRLDPTAPSHRRAQLLYRCDRGVTEGRVAQAAFSDDSRWLAVTTARGTTHLYAVHPEGGRPDVFSHVRLDGNPLVLRDLQKPRPPACCLLQPVARVYWSTLALPTEGEGTLEAYAARFSGAASADLRLLVTTAGGCLVQYKLLPTASKNPELDPRSLELQVLPAYWWDVCRHSSWAALPKREFALESSESKTGGTATSTRREPRWKSQVELYTHTMRYRPLLAGPQFRFIHNNKQLSVRASLSTTESPDRPATLPSLAEADSHSALSPEAHELLMDAIFSSLPLTSSSMAQSISLTETIPLLDPSFDFS